MNFTRGLKLNDLIVFVCAFENNHRFKNFFALIMEGIDTLGLFNFGMSKNNRDVTVTISHNVSIFFIECKLNEGTCQFFSHNKNITF